MTATSRQSKLDSVTSVHSHCTRWGKIIFRSLVAKFKSMHFNVVNKQLNSFVTLQFDLSETTQVLFLQTRVLIGARKTLMWLLLKSLDKKRCVSAYQSLARFMTELASLNYKYLYKEFRTYRRSDVTLFSWVTLASLERKAITAFRASDLVLLLFQVHWLS